MCCSFLRHPPAVTTRQVAPVSVPATVVAFCHEFECNRMRPSTQTVSCKHSPVRRLSLMVTKTPDTKAKLNRKKGSLLLYTIAVKPFKDRKDPFPEHEVLLILVLVVIFTYRPKG